MISRDSSTRARAQTSQVSFKLIDELLERAPLRQAARNQEVERAWAAQNDEANEEADYQLEHLFNERKPRGSISSENNDDEYTEQEEEEENNLDDSLTMISPSVCLERLRAHEVKYQVLDLFEETLVKNVLVGNEPLELLVSPSGVRAVKLVEFV